MLRVCLLLCSLAAAAADATKQQPPLEPLTKFRFVVQCCIGRACITLLAARPNAQENNRWLYFGKAALWRVALQFNFAGRLCAAAYVHNAQAYTVDGQHLISGCVVHGFHVQVGKACTKAANPNGASGREWCYVEVGALP